MLLSRQNLNGGKPLRGFPLEEENGVLGYKLGYCSGCNERVLVRTIDARYVLAHFHIGENDAKDLLKKLTPRVTLREWIIRKLGGQIASLEPINSY